MGEKLGWSGWQKFDMQQVNKAAGSVVYSNFMK